MFIGVRNCIKDIKCDECGKSLEEGKDIRYSINADKSNKSLIFCKECFENEFKERVKNICY